LQLELEIAKTPDLGTLKFVHYNSSKH